jgi:DNA (cytosine-5)-methyltransferase 1
MVHCLNDQGGKVMDVSEEKTGTLRAEAHGHAPIVHTIAIEGNGSRPSHKGNGYKETDKMYTINTTEVHGVAIGIDQQGGKGQANYAIEKSPTLAAESHGTPHAVCYSMGHDERSAQFTPNTTANTVRRLTPLECERLQGLPDSWTDVEFNGKPAPDSKRYKAIGNGMAVPCSDFIMRRIAEVSNGQNEGHD